MAVKSIKVNYIFSLINKLFAVLVPLLVTPYLARMLNADGNGVLSYVASFSSYFILVANLGVETYGQRVIAIHRDDKSYLKKFLIEVSLLRFILTAICLIIYYFLFISSFNKENNLLYAIYAITILAVVFDFSWFFQGTEEFGLLAFANIIARILYVVLIFVFIKSADNLSLAALFAVINTIFPYFISMPFIFKYMKAKTEGKINPFRHLKECIVYFIPTVAIQIYTVLDKTMIGLITHSDFENGYYEQAEKLVKLPLTITASLNVIVRSRISYYYSTQEYDKVHDLIDKSMNFAFMLSFPMMLGIMAVAPTLVPVYLGQGYDKCITILYVMSPIIPIISLSGLIGSDYYTPFNKQKISNIFLIIGSVVNIALNSFLIYFWQSVGAAVASVCAELVITALYIIFARKFINVTDYLKAGYKYLIASGVMFFPVFFMERFLPSNVWYLIAEVAVGIAVYTVMILILRVKFVYGYLRIYRDKILRKFRKIPERSEESAEAAETQEEAETEDKEANSQNTSEEPKDDSRQDAESSSEL